MTDDKKLYKGKVEIKNDANSFVMADNYYETHFLQAINFRLAYKAVVTVPTDFSILIEFQDHGANTSTVNHKSESESLKFVDHFQNRLPASSIINFLQAGRL